MIAFLKEKNVFLQTFFDQLVLT